MLDLAQELWSLTRELQAKANEKAWEEVEVIQVKRTKILQKIEQALTHLATDKTVAEARQLLERCKQAEAECLSLAEQARNDATKEQQKLSRGKAMKKAYGKR